MSLNKESHHFPCPLRLDLKLFLDCININFYCQLLASKAGVISLSYNYCFLIFLHQHTMAPQRQDHHLHILYPQFIAPDELNSQKLKLMFVDE